MATREPPLRGSLGAGGKSVAGQQQQKQPKQQPKQLRTEKELEGETGKGKAIKELEEEGETQVPQPPPPPPLLAPLPQSPPTPPLEPPPDGDVGVERDAKERMHVSLVETRLLLAQDAMEYMRNGRRTRRRR